MSAPSTSRVSRVQVTPVAFADPPLLNVVGVHQPWALRAIVEVHTDDGLLGLGETYGDSAQLARLVAVAAALPGSDPYDLHALRRLVLGVLARDPAGGGGASFGGMLDLDGPADLVCSPFEVAFLDLQGHAVGRPVSDLLGGAVRDRVPFGAYLFYKWAGHPDRPADDWGPASTPEEMVAQARRMVTEHGFGAIKVKGGVLEPDVEVATMHALAEAFPGHALRLDPNGAWTVPTSIRVSHELADVLDYLEDPTPGLAGMAQVRRESPLPLATNMCVIAFDHLRPAVLQGSVDIVLSDHHLWGGMRRSQLLAGICEAMGLGLSMHSNSHLGVSLAAMVHLAAATDHLDFACDTHYPWKSEDVVEPGVLGFTGGSVAVPTTPGLGVTLDRDALGRLHEQYLACGFRERQDTEYMRTVEPGFQINTARW